MAAPLLRFTLADGRPASLLVGEASTALAVDETTVSSWDLCGRPYALVRDGGTCRRGLDGGLLLERGAAADRPRRRRRLGAADAARFLEASGPVGILPPDQYLSLAVRLTEGCSWNACTF